MNWEVIKEGINWNKLNFVLSTIIFIAGAFYCYYVIKFWFFFYAFLFFLVLSIILYALITIRETKKSIEAKVYSGEKILFEIRGVGFSGRNFGSINFQWGRNILITNKRIILSYAWGVYQSYLRALSFYFKKSDCEKYKKWGKTGGDIYKPILGKNKFSFSTSTWGILNTHFTLHTKESERIYKIFRKYS
jgi:hypothetical protein